jgi:hypothetical protein
MEKITREVITEGEGKIPVHGDAVLIDYTMTFGEGVGSSTYDYDNDSYVDCLVATTHDEGPYSGPIPIVIGLDTLKDKLYKEGDSVVGLDDALLGMKVGSKHRVFIPPELGYGVEGGSGFHTFHGYRTPPGRGMDIIIEIVRILTEEQKDEILNGAKKVSYER